MHLKPSQKLKTLDSIDFFAVASILSRQHILCILNGCHPKNPEVVRHLGFFIPIFHSAILVDAKRQKRRVGGI